MKQKWEMCTTPDLVKIARTQNANMAPPPPTLINPFTAPAPVLINPISPFIAPNPRGIPMQLRPLRPPPRPLAPPKAKTPVPIQPKEKKFQVQVQANAKNIPESVRQGMIPADPVDPIEAKYREEMKRNQIEHKLQKARSIESEKCLPTDLLDDEDAEDAGDVKVTHPPPSSKLLHGGLADTSSDEETTEVKPIGHGRDRSKSERHNSESDGEFELNLSLGKADWGKITSKLTPDQIPGSPWSDAKVSTSEKSVQVDDEELKSGKGQLKIVHGNYKPATGLSISGDMWDSNEKSTQTDAQDEYKR